MSHNCAWCFKPFSDYGLLREHVDSEHANEYAAYCAAWEAVDAGEPDGERKVAGVVATLVGRILRAPITVEGE